MTLRTAFQPFQTLQTLQTLQPFQTLHPLQTATSSASGYTRMAPPIDFFRKPGLFVILNQHCDALIQYIDTNIYAKLFLVFCLLWWFKSRQLANADEQDEDEDDQEEVIESEVIPPGELLRFETTDVKYDQAVNILAYLYSKGLSVNNVEFPICSNAIDNTVVKIKFSSFVLKARKYRENPTESMSVLINKKPTIDQLMEAYAFYSNKTYRVEGADEEDEEDDNEDEEVDNEEEEEEGETTAL
jgi:hypothetical protein